MIGRDVIGDYGGEGGRKDWWVCTVCTFEMHKEEPSGEMHGLSMGFGYAQSPTRSSRVIPVCSPVLHVKDRRENNIATKNKKRDSQFEDSSGSS